MPDKLNTNSDRLFFRTFKIDIVVLFCLILIPTVLVITTYNYCKNSRSALKMANRLVEKIAESVVDKTITYLMPAHRLASISASVVEEEIPVTGSADAPADFLISIVRNQPQVAIAYFGTEEGQFLKADQLNPQKPLYTRFISGQLPDDVEVKRYFNQLNEVINEERTLSPSYDPRVRPWYTAVKECRRSFWTDPYVLAESGQPGISASCPVFDRDGEFKGVVAADITLGELSVFLKKNRISKNSIMFIMDKDRRLVAHPDPKAMLNIREGKIKAAVIEELGQPWITDIVRAYETHGKNSFSTTSKGVRYIASIRDFPEEFEKDWLIVVAAPEDDFLGTVKATHMTTLIISGVTLLVALFIGLVFAGTLSKPIEELTREVEKIQNFDLDGRIKIPSFVYEIRTLSNALDVMKTGLAGFGRYVSTDLVREIIKSGEEAVPGGKERELTLFFSDIENFTSISEGLPPWELMECLSEYINTLTKAVFNEKGTVDKYIGDAVMAFWGAPVAREDHAESACKAALEGLRMINSLNNRWKLKKRLPFNTRIGIHTAFTIVGNMGSEERLSYSVIGDGVNLASRLEGVNKIYGTEIIISHSTWRYVRNSFILRPLDIITVKGKSESVKIYELMGDETSKENESLKVLSEKFTKAHDYYLQRNWLKALELFENIQLSFPNDRPVGIYIRRCRSFIRDEPGAAWCGITKIDSNQQLSI